jgi:hypothetical protein
LLSLCVLLEDAVPLLLQVLGQLEEVPPLWALRKGLWFRHVPLVEHV